MQFYKEMYLGEGIKNKEKILWKLKYGAGMTDIYVISIAQGKNQLDCTHCAYFKQKVIREATGMIVGLAKGYGEAQGLLLSMMEETVAATGSANVKDYLLSRLERNEINQSEDAV